MSRSRVILGSEFFPDWRTGRPIANGTVYIGEVDLDPEILANRKTVYLIQEDGTEVSIAPASQPLTIGAGGIITYLGSPVQVLTDEEYSIKVLDGLGAQVYYFNSVVDTLDIESKFAQAANFYTNDPFSAANSYVVIPPITPIPAALLDGQVIIFRPSNNSTTGATLSVKIQAGYTTPKSIVMPDGASPNPNDYYKTSRDYMCRWDEANDVFVAVDFGLFSLNPSIQIWNSVIDYYVTPSYVSGSNGELYKSTTTSGPNLGGAINPVTDNTGVWIKVLSTSSPQYGYHPIYGLTLSNGVDAVNDIDIDTGSAKDSTGLYDIVFDAVMTKRIDAVWSAGSGGGGFPSGLTAGSPVNDTWYSYWAISKPDGTEDAGFGSEAEGISNTPTLLLADAAGYTLFRRVGWIYYGVATIVAFFQDGDDFVWDVLVEDVNVAAVSNAGANFTVSAPPLTKAYFMANHAATAGTNFFLITETRQTNSAASANSFDISSDFGAISYGSQFERYVDSSSQLRQRAANNNGTYTIQTKGWTDRRGQL